MNQPQRDSLDMFQRTYTYVKSTGAISGLRPALTNGNISLKKVIDKIIEKAGAQTEQTGGAATGKSTRKEAYVQKMFTMTSGTAGFAFSKGNSTLQEQMNYSVSDLRRLTDEMIVPTCNNILLIIHPLLTDPDLNDFGVDAAAETEATDARDLYIEVQNAPDLAEDETEAMTEALEPLFTDGKAIARNLMDRAADTLRETQTDWWNAYHNARKTIKTGNRITSADGDVFEVGTTTGIYKVEVTAVHEDGTTTVVKTDLDGHYKFIPLKFGIYTLTFKHPDFVDVVLGAFRIKLGERVTKNVFMTRRV